MLLALLFGQPAVYPQGYQTERLSSQPEYTEEVARRIKSIPDFKILPTSKSLESITFVDNSLLQYFPPVFNQRGNSCSQASGIGYIFTYEMNLVRNSAANSPSRIYAYHYTWNFLNGGTNSGSWYFDGYDLVMDNGVPSNSQMNDETVSYTEWMDGYSQYFHAMKNRISGYSKILASTKEGLEAMKQYLVDHGRGEAYGGLINFSTKVTGMDLESYFGPSETGVGYIVRTWSNSGDHAMTFVGFDDTVELDLNNNGQIDPDEKGALILVNSWGSDWADFGKAYMPYKLLKTPIGQGGIGNSDKYVYVIDCYAHNPTVTAKLVVNHDSRNDLRIRIGVSNDPNASEPQVEVEKKIIKNQGGDFNMLGTEFPDGNQIEIGLDFSELIENIPDAVRFFVTIYQSFTGSTAGSGDIISCSILDYRDDYRNPEEYVCSDASLDISSKTKLVIDQVATTIPKTEFKYPLSFELYPNPVKGKMQIDYSVTVPGEIRLDILDITGKVLQTLLQMESVPGKFHFNWIKPEEIVPGIYIVRLTQGGRGVTKQIIFE